MACRQPVMRAPGPPLQRPDVGALDTYLTSHWLFAGADDAFVRFYGCRIVQRTFPAKAIVYDQGDRADAVYIVRRGKARVGQLTPFGNDFITAIVGCDQLLGEETLFEARAPRKAQAMALTDSVLCIIPRVTFAEMLSRDSTVALNLARYVQAQRERAISTAVNLFSLKVPMRIRRLMHQLAAEHGVDDDDGTRIAVPLTHTDIAALVGSTRETVSLEINRLVRAGQLLRNKGYFTVRGPLVL